MKFRLGLIIGLAVGFLLGARAGRERYEQIVTAYKSVRSNEQVREATELAERSTRGTRTAAGRGMVSVAETVRAKSAR
ncbi:MAG: YtxH domain-containing protein [Actinobacteria bacterium]|nr:MAG: YtxH domain-containing protein [Actinomycetota bacterium]